GVACSSSHRGHGGTAAATTSSTVDRAARKLAADSSPSQPPSTTPGTAVGLEPADSATPAAGICGSEVGRIGNVTLNGGGNVPSPRCLVLRIDQLLSVTNATDTPITATVGTH